MLWRAAWLPVVLVVVACGERASHRQFHIVVQTQTDEGKKLAGVKIRHGDRLLGVSNSLGELEVRLSAAENSVFTIQPECPKDYSASRDQVQVRFQASPSSATSPGTYGVTLECKPRLRDVAVVVVTNVEGLPIELNHKVVAKTDSDGVAHLGFQQASGGKFDIRLNTSDDNDLLPPNPVATHTVPEHAELFVINQSFSRYQPPPEAPKPLAPTARSKKRPKKRLLDKEKFQRPLRITSGKRDASGSL